MLSEQSGEYFSTKRVGRGAAFGDYDNDGDTDIFVVNLNQGGDAAPQRRWKQTQLADDKKPLGSTAIAMGLGHASKL